MLPHLHDGAMHPPQPCPAHCPLLLPSPGQVPSSTWWWHPRQQHPSALGTCFCSLPDSVPSPAGPRELPGPKPRAQGREAQCWPGSCPCAACPGLVRGLTWWRLSCGMGKPGSLPSAVRACLHLPAGSPLPALPPDLPQCREQLHQDPSSPTTETSSAHMSCTHLPPAPRFSAWPVLGTQRGAWAQLQGVGVHGPGSDGVGGNRRVPVTSSTLGRKAHVWVQD